MYNMNEKFQRKITILYLKVCKIQFYSRRQFYKCTGKKHKYVIWMLESERGRVGSSRDT